MAQVLGDVGGGDQLRRSITVPQGVALYLGALGSAAVIATVALAYRRLLGRQPTPAGAAQDALSRPAQGR